MVKTKIYNLEGKAFAEKKLKDEIFSLKINPKIVTQVVNSQLCNRRQAIAHTKTRSEVRGGGRKPFRQKGTGKARAGSSRSPIWIGGGITFGPRKIRNFHKRLPQKIRKAALKMALSQKINDKKLIVLKEFELAKPSTKLAEQFLQKLPIEEGSILVILPKMNVNLELALANLPYLKTIQTENINIIDLLKYDYLITNVEGIEKMEKVLSGKLTKAKS